MMHRGSGGDGSASIAVSMPTDRVLLRFPSAESVWRSPLE